LQLGHLFATNAAVVVDVIVDDDDDDGDILYKATHRLQ
jgi:hypothetical protein